MQNNIKMIYLPGLTPEKMDTQQSSGKKSNVYSMEKALMKSALEKEAVRIRQYLEKYEAFAK